MKIFEILDNYIRTINPFYQSFKQFKDIEQEQILKAQREKKPIPAITLYFKTCPQDDKRRFNVPKTGEVSAVFVGENGNPPINRDFAVYSKISDRLQLLKVISPNVDPMVYVLLFPFGEQGWHPNLKQKTDKAK